jgi:hypothetical protein
VNTPRDVLRRSIIDAIWTELKQQSDDGDAFGPYVDRSSDLIDGCVNMNKIADAVINTLPDQPAESEH